MKIKTYASTFVLSFIGLFVFIAAFNYFVNPYDVWSVSCIQNVNCKKTQAGNKIYYTKSKQWQDIDFDGLILGNSRLEIGINPNSDAFPSSNNYNLSIRGARVADQALYLQNVLKTKKPKYIVLGIDFFSFRRRPHAPDAWPIGSREYLKYDVLGNPLEDYTITNTKYAANALFSLVAATDSVMTLINQHRQVSYLNHQGFDHGLGFETIHRIEGVEAAFKNDLRQLRQKFEGEQFSLKSSNAMNSEFEALKLILKLSREQLIPIFVYISPVHIEYLNILNETGHLDLYFEWKESLVQTLAQQGYYRQQMLYDFSSPKGFVLETVPKGRNQTMQWWYEAGHYQPTLGDYMLREIFSAGYRYRLTPSNVHSKLVSERAFFN